MAVYLVAKQWRGERKLVAPMVLMFVSGAVKYGERIWSLRAAAVRSSSTAGLAADLDVTLGHDAGIAVAIHYSNHLSHLVGLISSEGKASIERILEEAYIEFPGCLDFFMDVAPLEVAGQISGVYDSLERALMESKSSKNAEWVLYNLVEMKLSLIHDFLYTKFGAVRFHAPKKMNPTTLAALQWLVPLGLTSMALVLFARASRSSNDHNHYQNRGLCLVFDSVPRAK
jgi:hypothetical protein